MGKKRKTEKMQERYPTEDYLIPAVILMIMLLSAWTWAMIVSKNGLQGSAYFFTAFDVVLILMVSVPYALKSIIASVVHKRVEQRQFRNAKIILNAGLLVAILYSITAVLLIFVFANSLIQSVLIGPKSYLTLIILNIAIVFYSVACVFMGYFEGMGGTFPLLSASLIGRLIMAVSTIVFSGIFMSRGMKAANVLRSQETLYAYGAAGAAVGVLSGIFMICILMIFMYKLYGNYFRSLLKRDSSKRKTDTVDVVSWLAMQVIPLAGSYFMMFLYPVIDQFIFFRVGEARGETILLTYQWGAYSGVYRGMMFLPLLIALAMAASDKRRLVNGYKSGDLQEVRIKINGIIRDNIVISLFFAMLLLVMADKIMTGFFIVESAMAVRLARFGCIALVLLSLSVMLLIILPTVNMSLASFIAGICALAANVITAYITVQHFSMGIYGILLSLIVFGIVYVPIGMFFLRRAVGGRLDKKSAVYLPIAAAAITGVVMLLFDLLFGLFLPPILNVIFTVAIAFLVYFIALSKFEVISMYSVSASPFGGLLFRLGKMIGLYP